MSAPLMIDDGFRTTAMRGRRRGRASVGGELWLHTIALTTAGGAAVGASVVVGAAGWQVIQGDTAAVQLIAVALLVAFFGGVAGLLLGLVAGAVVGLVGARLLVPYPGRYRVLAFGRAAGLAVAMGFDLGVMAVAGHATTQGMLLALVPLAFGWLLAPSLVRWYIVENEGAR